MTTVVVLSVVRDVEDGERTLTFRTAEGQLKFTGVNAKRASDIGHFWEDGARTGFAVISALDADENELLLNIDFRHDLAWPRADLTNRSLID